MGMWCLRFQGQLSIEFLFHRSFRFVDPVGVNGNDRDLYGMEIIHANGIIRRSRQKRKQRGIKVEVLLLARGKVLMMSRRRVKMNTH